MALKFEVHFVQLKFLEAEKLELRNLPVNLDLFVKNTHCKRIFTVS